ncbi:MAG: hypothetical protein Q9191_004833, partial [Dirinaria sp. TL-2023a]
MKLLSHIRSKSRLKNGEPQAQVYEYGASNPGFAYPSSRPNPTAKLPDNALKAIFAAVCPHSQDDSYLSSEDSMPDGGCLLCDLRDLAHCAMVNRQWAGPAQDMLYHSIRIDPVHYCQLEFELCEKRKRKSHRFDRNGEQADAPAERLQLLSRTVRENQYLASQVQFLKMPYMTRESCVADLARTVQVLPNLRFIDLPEGFFSDSPSSATLKQELQVRCPDIRKMRYTAGAERSFIMLPQTRQWQNLEVLELSRLLVEPSMLTYALSSFPVLQELKLVNLPLLEDSIFQPGPQRNSFPPLAKLSLRDTPNITASGLATYLSSPVNRENLSSLTLTNTGILIESLHSILATAPYLTNLHITESVSRSLPLQPTPPPLTSR